MERRRRQRKNYFHPMDSEPIFKDGKEIATSKVDCMKCIENQKNSDIRRIILQCEESLNRRNTDRRNILNNAYNKFSVGQPYFFHGKKYTSSEDFYEVGDFKYIDKHQYTGFRHNIENLHRCNQILKDRVTNPYYVFFFYPTKEYEHQFHSSHRTERMAIDEIQRSIDRNRKSDKMYFIKYFGVDDDDDGFIINEHGVFHNDMFRMDDGEILYRDSAKLRDTFLSPMPYTSL